MGSTSNDLQSPLLSSIDDDNFESRSERMGIDEMLRRYAGEFGWWQLKHFVLTCTAWALEALHTMAMIFADQTPAWRCSSLGGPCPADPCGAEPGSWDWVGGRSGSTVAEWGLVCGQKYKFGLVQSGFFLGCMIGAGVFGHLSDSFLGRKGSLTIVCILNAVFGFLTALSPSYWFYATLRVLTGFSTGGVGLCAFVLATEPIGPRMRGAAGMSTFYFFSGGIALLSGIAYLIRSWRALYVVTSLPSLLFIAVILPFVSESPRWYLVRHKLDDAMSVMRKIAHSNRKHIPDNTTLKLDDNKEEDTEKNRGGFSRTGCFGLHSRRNSLTDHPNPSNPNCCHQRPMLGRLLRPEPQCRQPEHQPVPNRSTKCRGRDSSIRSHGGLARPVRAEATRPRNNVVQRCVLRGRNIGRGDEDEDGVRHDGDIWYGGDVQFAGIIYGGAVSDDGEERSVGVRDAGLTDGGHTGAAGGGSRGRCAICGVWSLRDRRWNAGVLLAGDDEPAVV